MDSLTRWEWRALEGGINLADGHARQIVGGHEQDLVSKLTSIYRESYIIAQKDAERRFLVAYWRLLGLQMREAHLRPIFHYSSSLSIDTVAKLLFAEGLHTYLVSPTFDNIPALLRRNAVTFSPLLEDEIRESALTRLNNLGSARIAIFVVNPNNPTGTVLSRDEFARLAGWCASSRSVIVVDNSFRIFRPSPLYDDLSILQEAGCSFISIEDTGKGFSTNDIKLGFVVCSNDMYGPLASVTDEIMLNVSTFALLFLEAVADSVAHAGGPHLVQSLVARNRAALGQALAGTPLQLTSTDSPIGIGWLRLPDSWVAHNFVTWLSGRKVGILPGNPFYWHSPNLGDHFVRVALMREEAYFARSIQVLAELANQYSPNLTKE